jgi:hypothetical protein
MAISGILASGHEDSFFLSVEYFIIIELESDHLLVSLRLLQSYRVSLRSPRGTSSSAETRGQNKGLSGHHRKVDKVATSVRSSIALQLAHEAVSLRVHSNERGCIRLHLIVYIFKCMYVNPFSIGNYVCKIRCGYSHSYVVIYVEPIVTRSESVVDRGRKEKLKLKNDRR